MRERDANATLADALHALARDYGFASWPKLKAHVESGFSRISGASPSASSSSAPLFPRFTEAAKRTLFFRATRPPHLGVSRLLPNTCCSASFGARAGPRAMLETSGITLDAARGTIEAANAPRDEVVEPVQVPFQSSTKTLFTLAAEEADRLGHERSRPCTSCSRCCVIGELRRPFWGIEV